MDTKWYCFDDSTCSPLVENPTYNILNTGFNSVCTENAYILFYKRRHCMTNETWWINHVDRALYNSQEFVDFYHDLALIEQRQQQSHTEAQQRRGNVPSANEAANTNGGFKKPSSGGLRSSIKSKLLGTSKSGTQLNYTNNSSGDALNSDYVGEANRAGSEFLYQRELNRQIERQQQQQQFNLINLDDQFLSHNGSNTMINYYDEMHRPKRLSGGQQHHKTSNSSSHSSGGGGGGSSNTTTTHSTPSKGGSNYVSSGVDANTLHKVLGMDTGHMTQGNTPPLSSMSSASGTNNSSDNNLVDLGNNFTRQMNLNGHSTMIGEPCSDDLLLNYPSDNEYVAYNSTKQRVMDQFKNSYNNDQQRVIGQQYVSYNRQLPAVYGSLHQNQRSFQPVYSMSSPTTPPPASPYPNGSNASGNSGTKSRYANPRIETNI